MEMYTHLKIRDYKYNSLYPSMFGDLFFGQTNMSMNVNNTLNINIPYFVKIKKTIKQLSTVLS
jgi:hypothetical protein